MVKCVVVDAKQIHAEVVNIDDPRPIPAGTLCQYHHRFAPAYVVADAVTRRQLRAPSLNLDMSLLVCSECAKKLDSCRQIGTET